MLIKNKKISICGEDKLYFSEGCWQSCDNIPVLTLTVSITSSPENHWGYQTDEVVTYEAVLTNDGDSVTNKINISDSFGTTYRSRRLASGESEVFSFSHTVTASEVAEGPFTITITAEDFADASLTVNTYGRSSMGFVSRGIIGVGTASNPARIGDTVRFHTQVINNGETSLTDIVFSDNLTGTTYTIDRLEIGETSEDVVVAYVVSEEDMTYHEDYGNIVRLVVDVHGWGPGRPDYGSCGVSWNNYIYILIK